MGFDEENREKVLEDYPNSTYKLYSDGGWDSYWAGGQRLKSSRVLYRSEWIPPGEHPHQEWIDEDIEYLMETIQMDEAQDIPHYGPTLRHAQFSIEWD